MKTTSRSGNQLEETGAVSNHDEIILSINEDVAGKLDTDTQNRLYKLRFGFWACKNGFRACFNTDETVKLYQAKVFLRRHKIPYERIHVKAGIDDYKSNT